MIVATAMAVTALGSAPARADEDVLRALAAIAGIAIVGKIIYDQQTRADKKVVTPRRADKKVVTPRRADKKVVTPKRAEKRVVTPGRYNASTRTYDLKPRPLPERAQRRLLPGDCLRSAETRDGRVRYFGRGCLQQNYARFDHLPEACAVRFRADRGTRRGYEARCLADRGYQLARR
ncbi:hypothetical protein [uncultured Roseobacter sp.]|uniref:hypothetical protein n=1 Tax=uncultured Roseobacter sp. TaxID=114847 RepID=UPI002607A7BD|nr:hypothetical protein [uncultured Roseobacter sp.]